MPPVKNADFGPRDGAAAEPETIFWKRALFRHSGGAIRAADMRRHYLAMPASGSPQRGI
jgi:hypothetical protein